MEIYNQPGILVIHYSLQLSSKSSLFPTTEGLEKQLSHDHARKQDNTKQ